MTATISSQELDRLARLAGERTIPLHIESEWTAQLQLDSINNVLELNAELLEESLRTALPPHLGNVEWKEKIGDNATYRGRYQIPHIFLRYDADNDQPRAKSNDQDHINELSNSYRVQGYRLECQPPVGKMCGASNPFHVSGLSGFHRFGATSNIGQKSNFYDIYDFASPYFEIVARNITNHHLNPALSQNKHDVLKEVLNAIESDVIEKNADAISKLVEDIASDKPSETRKWIKEKAFKGAGVYPQFRTFGSKGNGQHTLKYCVETELKFPKMGFEGRTDQEMKKQGYIVYTGNCGDVLRGWGAGIYRAKKYGIPVWILGYSANRVDSLVDFRENFIDQFLDYKEAMIRFAFDLFCEEGECDKEMEEILDMLDQDVFPVKLAGFLPQYRKPDNTKGGRPTEVGLVDVYGNTLKFNPTGKCLTQLI